MSKDIMRVMVLYILSMFFYLSSFSQDFKCFNYKYKPDWTDWEHDEVTIDILKSNFESIKNRPYSELKDVLENIDNYHLVDINNDKVNELIYNGWYGGEGEAVFIYKLYDEKYIESQHFFGRICDIRRTELNQVRLIVYDYACCAGYVDHIETFDFNESTQKFEITNSISKITETKIPNEFIEPVKFKIGNTPYNLRYSPEILTGLEEGYFDFDPINGQNISAIYKSGDTGTAYAESTDSTGRVWWFVIMDKKT